MGVVQSKRAERMFYMGEDRRITEHPILEDLREPDTYILYNGKSIPAITGEPIAAALLAAGVRIMRHTAKSGQPRGIFCGIGRCNDCKMIVDGVPGVRTCVTLVREGMEVETQEGLGEWRDLA